MRNGFPLIQTGTTPKRSYAACMHVARSVAMLVVALGAALGLASTASAATCAGSGYLVTSAGTIQRFSTSTNAVTATLTGVGTQFADVAVSPDGRTVYAVDTAANLVRVIDTSTNTISASISGLSTPVAIAIAPDGTRAYVVNSGSDTFAAVDTTALTVTGSYPAGTSPTDAVVSADGALLYVTAGTDLTARSTTTGAVQTTFALGATASAVARSATTAYTANDTPFSISSALLSGSNANVLFSGIVGQPTAITVSPDGTRLYLGTSAVGRNSLMTASISDGALTSIGSAASFAVTDVAVAPDGSAVYATDYTQVTVTNAAGSPVTTLSGAVANAITSIAICPAAVPGAPTAPVADPGDTVASLSWTAPTDTGGAPITRYTATATPGGATCTTAGAHLPLHRTQERHGLHLHRHRHQRRRHQRGEHRLHKGHATQGQPCAHPDRRPGHRHLHEEGRRRGLQRHDHRCRRDRGRDDVQGRSLLPRVAARDRRRGLPGEVRDEGCRTRPGAQAHDDVHPERLVLADQRAARLGEAVRRRPAPPVAQTSASVPITNCNSETAVIAQVPSRSRAGTNSIRSKAASLPRRATPLIRSVTWV